MNLKKNLNVLWRHEGIYEFEVSYRYEGIYSYKGVYCICLNKIFKRSVQLISAANFGVVPSSTSVLCESEQ